MRSRRVLLPIKRENSVKIACPSAFTAESEIADDDVERI
jgi:hypothetical protein